MDAEEVNKVLRSVINGLIIASVDLQAEENGPADIYWTMHQLFKKGLRAVAPAVQDIRFSKIFDPLFDEEEVGYSDVDSCDTIDNVSWTSARIVASESQPVSRGSRVRPKVVDRNVVAVVEESDTNSIASLPVLVQLVPETDFEDFSDDAASDVGSMTYFGDVAMDFSNNSAFCTPLKRKRVNGDNEGESAVKRPKFADLLGTPITPKFSLFGCSTPVAAAREQKQSSVSQSIDLPLIPNEYSSDVLSVGYFPTKFSSDKMLFGASYSEANKEDANPSKMYKTHLELFDDLLNPPPN